MNENTPPPLTPNTPNTPPSPAPAPVPLPSSDEKIWIILSHLSILFGFGFILPLVVYLVKKQDSPLTADHAKEALNFHISVYLYGFAAGLLCIVLIGFVLLPIVFVFMVVCAILAAIKASDGGFYRYPLTIRLI